MMTKLLQEVDQMSWEPISCSELYEALSFFRSYDIPLLLIDAYVAADWATYRKNNISSKRIMGLANKLLNGEVSIDGLIEDGFFLVHGRQGKNAEEFERFAFHMTMDGIYWKSE